jgi:hypothetical protein
MRNSKNGLVSSKDYVAGWLNSTIHDFLEHFPRSSKGIDYALITSLDSNVSPCSLLGKSPELKSCIPHAKSLATGILLPTELMLNANASNQIFFGFDEIWFFPDDRIDPKPGSIWLVGPNRIDQRKIEELGPWMQATRCALALGDGDGLNFIVKARGLVKHLLAYTIFQPQPVTGGEEEVACHDRGALEDFLPIKSI